MHYLRNMIANHVETERQVNHIRLLTSPGDTQTALVKYAKGHDVDAVKTMVSLLVQGYAPDELLKDIQAHGVYQVSLTFFVEQFYGSQPIGTKDLE